MTGNTSEATALRVHVEPKPGSQVTLTVAAPATEVDRAVDAALRRLNGRLRIPGFRPGKAPLAIVERQLGWETVRQEALESLVPDVYLRALDQENIQAVGDPSLDVDPEKLARGQDLEFTATVTVVPEVDLGDYLAIRVDTPSTEVPEEEVDKAIETVRERHGELVDTDREVRTGDVIRAILEMRHKDELVGGTDGEERDLEVDPDRLIAGLAEKLAGMHAGDDTTFALTLPEDFENSDLRGEEVSIHAVINQVRERVLPPADDALAVTDGHGTTLDELREFYRQSLREVAERRAPEVFEEQVLTAFREGLRIDVPEAMVEAELDRQLRDMQYQVEAMGLPFAQYLSILQSSPDKLRGERRPNAIDRVKLELGLDKLAEAEGIEVDESQVEAEEERLAGGHKYSAQQRRRLHLMAHVDLRRQASAQRLMEIARGDA